MKMKTQFAALTCVLLLCVAGCSEGGPGTPVAASEILNTHCPVMGGEIDGQTFVEWNGQKVGFCCPPCIDDWKEMADTERTDKLAEAAANAGSSEEHADHEHDDHDHSAAEEHSGDDDASSDETVNESETTETE
jgi:hypothetical protein